MMKTDSRNCLLSVLELEIVAQVVHVDFEAVDNEGSRGDVRDYVIDVPACYFV